MSWLAPRLRAIAQKGRMPIKPKATLVYEQFGAAGAALELQEPYLEL